MMLKLKRTQMTMVAMLAVILGGCGLIPKKSAVEIMSNVTAKVFINGKEAGVTPYKNSSLVPGEIEIKMEAEGQTWTRKLMLHNNVNTVVDWEFGKSEEQSGGYILYMEKTGDGKKAGIMISGSPDKSSVHIDGEVKGFTPMRLDDIGQGDRQVSITYPAYKGLNVFVKAIKGYQLVIEANLASQKEQLEITEEPTPTDTAEITIKKRILIKETETGWLRVREQPNSGSIEVKKVNPGEKYDLLEEQEGWYKIDLGNGKSGWVNAKYAEII